MAKVDPKKATAQQSNSSNPQLEAILQRMDALEAENKALQKEVSAGKPKDPKKKYEWKRAYSFKKWWGMPVIKYVSYRKDPTMDFVDKNPITGKYVENQGLKVTCINKDKEEEVFDVLAIEFGKNHGMSDKIKCEVLKDGNVVTGYKFNDEHFGEFVVLPEFIN